MKNKLAGKRCLSGDILPVFYVPLKVYSFTRAKTRTDVHLKEIRLKKGTDGINANKDMTWTRGNILKWRFTRKMAEH